MFYFYRHFILLPFVLVDVFASNYAFAIVFAILQI